MHEWLGCVWKWCIPPLHGRFFIGTGFFLTNRCWGSPYVQTKPYLVGGLEPWNFMIFHILGISSSQLTFTPSFCRGVGRYRVYHQPAKYNHKMYFGISGTIKNITINGTWDISRFHVFPKVNPMDIFMDIPADCLWILMFSKIPMAFFRHRISSNASN